MTCLYVNLKIVAHTKHVEWEYHTLKLMKLGIKYWTTHSHQILVELNFRNLKKIIISTTFRKVK